MEYLRNASLLKVLREACLSMKRLLHTMKLKPQKTFQQQFHGHAET
jgi:hypothetical protein